MPISVNGTGTRFYGARIDGNHGLVTTQWFTLLFVPIVPIRSMRISYAGGNIGIFWNTTEYHVLERLPLQLGQILRVYGFLFASVFWFILVSVGVIKFGGDSPSIPFLVLAFVGFMPAPFWALYFIRRN